MTESVTLRAAKPSDLPTLQAFEQGIILAERPYDATLKPDPISYYDIGEMIEDPDAEVAVAEINGELVASGYAIKKASRHYVSPAHHAFIGFLFVVPEHRGKGLNQKILEHLFAWAQTAGLPEVHLTVYPDNASAIRAYEKVGFKPYLSEMRLNLEEL
ncbi:MAG: GNAT family N-acetyltransferase [Pseudomonadota bacterium]